MNGNLSKYNINSLSFIGITHRTCLDFTISSKIIFITKSKHEIKLNTSPFRALHGQYASSGGGKKIMSFRFNFDQSP